MKKLAKVVGTVRSCSVRCECMISWIFSHLGESQLTATTNQADGPQGKIVRRDQVIFINAVSCTGYSATLFKMDDILTHHVHHGFIDIRDTQPNKYSRSKSCPCFGK